jgi:hypothetical protein
MTQPYLSSLLVSLQQSQSLLSVPDPVAAAVLLDMNKRVAELAARK